MFGFIKALMMATEREEGQALAEYALILAFIAAACVLAVTALGLAISWALDSITGSF
jgi:Flp pilus assembly pilin Flp